MDASLRMSTKISLELERGREIQRTRRRSRRVARTCEVLTSQALGDGILRPQRATQIRRKKICLVALCKPTRLTSLRRCMQSSNPVRPSVVLSCWAPIISFEVQAHAPTGEMRMKRPPPTSIAELARWGKTRVSTERTSDVLDKHAHHVHIAHNVDCRKYAQKL